MHSVVIDPRFCGPAHSGNGGYTCGLLAEALPTPIEVTLRAPPPLAVELAWQPAADGGGSLWHDGSLIAQALPTRFELEVPAAVSLAAAAEAEKNFGAFQQHPYPSCFVCGPSRAPGDGLRIFPGPVAGSSRPLVAAPWIPDAGLGDESGHVAARYLWAALDCPSWFGYASFADDVPTILLGRLALQLERAPRVGQPCVIVGWSFGREGRRILCAAALYDADGECLARARSTWIALKPDSQG